jgi:hypothetical protein
MFVIIANILYNINMKCPYCLENFVESSENISLFDTVKDSDGFQYGVKTTTCSNTDCSGRIIYLRKTYFPDNTGLPANFGSYPSTQYIMVHPKVSSRGVDLSNVPENFKDDYLESCEVLATSAKASAALTRRLLQRLIHEKANIDEGNLNDEIGLLIESVDIPRKLKELLDAVRVIGNFAAHPEKSINSGAIIDVEPAEAEVNLDTIEELFDFYFIQPKIHEERMRKINDKLIESGKQSLDKTIADRAKKLSNKKRTIS